MKHLTDDGITFYIEQNEALSSLERLILQVNIYRIKYMRVRVKKK